MAPLHLGCQACDIFNFLLFNFLSLIALPNLPESLQKIYGLRRSQNWIVLDRFYSRRGGFDFTTLTYADDVALLIVEKFLQTVSHLMQGALVKKSCGNGLWVKSYKVELVLLTRRGITRGWQISIIFTTGFAMIGCVKFEEN